MQDCREGQSAHRHSAAPGSQGWEVLRSVGGVEKRGKGGGAMVFSRRFEQSAGTQPHLEAGVE